MEKTKIEGNPVWRALKRNGAAGRFAAGEDALLEATMRLIGSVVVEPPEAAPDGKGDLLFGVAQAFATPAMTDTGFADLLQT